ncbi:hypothetical protein EGR_10175 [Echinococcus granulosus]|uniref:Uncharacterized protein n=1 Tax=Echinococcus granulosus TaxID=6210 RepID=W6U902_ECHGR|nr:hypothetical protein EGR_10175 [Echinococcus granulosus]EUB54967.1 hypothetical protein EGR_10175 [Echinococcus granulosus]
MDFAYLAAIKLIWDNECHENAVMIPLKLDTFEIQKLCSQEVESSVSTSTSKGGL